MSTLDAQRLGSILTTKRFGRETKFFDVIASTQKAAHELAAAGAPEGTLVVAEEQSGGIGRRGRLWHSAPGLGLWFSMVLRPRIPVESGGLLSAWAGLAVLETLGRDGVLPGDTGLKWPNDVLVKGRKICGILIDASSSAGEMTYAILGIGLNTGHSEEDFPEEIAGVATSLAMEAGGAPDRAEVLAGLLSDLERSYGLVSDPEGRRKLVERAGSASVLTGKRVRVISEGGLKTGRVKGIAPGGGLILGSGPCGADEVILSGDVKVLEFEEEER
jgi:BirA family biotin operon repressor/biotin-[acetyl-CoA-carboxylase] ligase